jgi:hypothetical protein
MYKFLVLQVTIYGSDFSLPQTGSLAKKSIFPARPCLYWAGGNKARTCLFTDTVVSYASANRGPVFQFAGVTSGVSSNVRCIFFRFFSLNFRFTSIFLLNFRLFFLPFSLQIFVVSHRSESCEIRLFFRFQAKRNFRFYFKFRFRSESEGAP